jgi:xanthine dehydrogenase D subunit
VSIDYSEALAMPGVHTVLTHEDVPGAKTYGMKVADQPVLAIDQVRYQGEPVAILAADNPEIARQAVKLVHVEYDVMDPVVDAEVALDPGSRAVQEGMANGNLVRHVKIRHGDMERATREAEVVVSGVYETGMQDHAYLGPESGLAVPAEDGGVELYVSAQWLHKDREQMAPCLALPEEKVRLTLAGVGGAFGGREDLSIHLHACMLALRLGKPVKMSYNRYESFMGHVHRHPSKMYYEHGATRDGKLVYVKARLVMDGGAYTSTSPVVIANGSYFVAGAYDVPNAQIDGFAAYTNNPPTGAMRGFGAVQACYGVESNMDKLARALNMDPLELRIRNAMQTGTVLPTGQAVDGPAPVAELLERLGSMPLPPERSGAPDIRELPGGVGNTSHGEGIRRGVGYAVGVKAIGYSGGVDDISTARVAISVAGGEPMVSVHTAAAECGQGVTTVQAQIARTELGVPRVVVLPADTQVGDAGSASASRMTWMSSGAVQGACRQIARELIRRAAALQGRDAAGLKLGEGYVVDATTGGPVASVVDLLGAETLERTHEFHHRPTQSIDDETGQGDAHIAYAFAAHRAVVDVDTELGLVKVVELATTQDVGKAMNPLAVEGQIEGGSAQGLGLALMEEIQLDHGKVRNPSFTDYLIPTILDMPPMRIELFEYPHPDSPYGLNGVGEPPTLSSTPAILNALRDATGLELPRAPITPDDIALARRVPANAEGVA